MSRNGPRNFSVLKRSHVSSTNFFLVIYVLCFVVVILGVRAVMLQGIDCLLFLILLLQLRAAHKYSRIQSSCPTIYYSGKSRCARN